MSMAHINFALELATAFYMLMILLGHLEGGRVPKRRPDYFGWMVILDIVMLLSDTMVYYLILSHLLKYPRYMLLKQIMNSVDFIAYYVFLTVFVFYVTDCISESAPVSWLLAKLTLPVCIVYTVIWCISSFNGMIFRETRVGLVRGPYYWVGQLGGYFVILMVIWLVFRYRAALGWKKALTFLSFIFFPVGASFLRILFPHLAYIPLALSMSLLLVSNFLLKEQAKKLQEQELRLEKARIVLMFSQIKPHFLYNALNSIYVLCGRDPEKAQQAVGEFSEYLRGNLEGMNQEKEITMEKELQHVKHYLHLEKLRYREDLNIEYEIETMDFRLPPLSLQPIVENAVKHGIMKKKGGGTVLIATQDKGDHAEITVKDDGVGFDPKKLPEDGELHLGLKSVRDRLWEISRGTLAISSVKNEGTTVTICIPY